MGCGKSFQRFKIFINMNLRKIIKEEINDFDWIPKKSIITNEFDFDGELNTDEANQNFKNEVNGYYAISTPKDKESPETIIAYGPVFYIKQVLRYIDSLNDPYWGGMDLYLGVVKYSRKDKDNVLSLIKYY